MMVRRWSLQRPPSLQYQISLVHQLRCTPAKIPAQMQHASANRVVWKNGSRQPTSLPPLVLREHDVPSLVLSGIIAVSNRVHRPRGDFDMPTLQQSEVPGLAAAMTHRVPSWRGCRWPPPRAFRDVFLIRIRRRHTRTSSLRVLDKFTSSDQPSPQHGDKLLSMTRRPYANAVKAAHHSSIILLRCNSCPSDELVKLVFDVRGHHTPQATRDPA